MSSLGPLNKFSFLEAGNLVIFNVNLLKGDSPLKFQLSFQDPATNYMEGLFCFNSHLLILIIGIVCLVGWMLSSILTNYLEIDSSNVDKFNHSNNIEIVWTTVPAFLLAGLASPSFSLLYGLDETTDPSLTVKIFGHQWYWRYELSDTNACFNSTDIRFSSYLLSDEYLSTESNGLKRILEVNRRLVLPTTKIIRLLITSVDVLHSWTIPSFGVKVDACPGRLNQAHLFLKRCGLFFGQCSEICGVNHGFMPIAVLAVPSLQFNTILLNRIKQVSSLATISL
jgi:cytochrome c oxidase subunit 2